MSGKPIRVPNVQPQLINTSQTEARALTGRPTLDLYDPLDELLTPVRCWTCGKVIREGPVVELLQKGVHIGLAMDEAGYERICCRRMILSAPSFVQLQKQIAELQKPKQPQRLYGSYTITLNPLNKVKPVEQDPRIGIITGRKQGFQSSDQLDIAEQLESVVISEPTESQVALARPIMTNQYNESPEQPLQYSISTAPTTGVELAETYDYNFYDDDTYYGEDAEEY